MFIVAESSTIADADVTIVVEKPTRWTRVYVDFIHQIIFNRDDPEDSECFCGQKKWTELEK